MRKPFRPEEWGLIVNTLRLLWIPGLANELRSEEESATIRRFYSSEHVKDLRLISGIALMVVFVSFILIVIYVYGRFDENLSPGTSLGYLLWLKLTTGSYLNYKLGTIAGVTGVAGVVIAWAYKTAAIRLGVVDLFASEIMTTCRIGTALNIGTDSVERYRSSKRRLTNNSGAQTDKDRVDNRIRNFTSEEDYFTIFSANSKELEVLEADVVSEITSFYTYMKIIRDLMRKIAGPATKGQLSNLRYEIVYMLFLSYESARRSIDHLVEYEPTHVENTIIILLTEIVAYKNLLKIFGTGHAYRVDAQAHNMLNLVEIIHRLRQTVEEYDSSVEGWAT